MANVTAPSSNWSVDRETGHVDVLTLWIVAADGFICVSGLVGNALVIYVISRASFKSNTTSPVGLHGRRTLGVTNWPTSQVLSGSNWSRSSPKPRRLTELSMVWVDPWVGLGWVEIFQLLVDWVGLGPLQQKY